MAADDIYVGTRRVGWTGMGADPWCSAADGLDDALAQLAHRLSAVAPQARRVRLWLSGGLCRPFVMEVPADVADEAEFEMLVQALGAERTGLAAPCTYWIEPRTASAARVAVLVEDASLTKCRAAAARFYRRVTSIQPWWAEALRAASQDAGLQLLGVRDCDSLTVLAAETDAFSLASSYAPITDDTGAQAAWLRAAGSVSPRTSRTLHLRLEPQLASSAQPMVGVALGCWAGIQP